MKISRSWAPRGVSSRRNWLAVLILGACVTTPADVPRLAGTLQLAAVDGHVLPFDVGTLPPPPGFPDAPTCHILISRGTFSFVEPNQFAYLFRSIDSCSGREIGGGSGEGTLSQAGAKIELKSAVSDGTYATYRGTFDGHKLDLKADGFLLTFDSGR